MSRIGIAIGLLGVSLSFAAGRLSSVAAKTTVLDEHVGYRLQAPDFQGRYSQQMRIVLYGPVSLGFAPNVNVTLQAASTRKAYIKLSRSGLEAAGLTIDSQSELTVSGRDAVMWKYHGQMQGRELAFLGLAVMGEDRVYLVTCTATPKQFQEQETAFENCLKSFELLLDGKP